MPQPAPDLDATRVAPSTHCLLTRRQALVTGVAGMGAAAVGLPRWAHAQGGSRPLRVILPLSAGSGADGAIRAISNSLAKALGQAVVIENLPGAGGITGTSQIVRAPKDGSVIGVVSNNHVVNPSVYKNIPFDSLADITPITILGATPFVLVAHPSVPAKTVQELIALARAKPGVLNYGSSGNGTILHLGAAMFVDQAKVVIQHIPIRTCSRSFRGRTSTLPGWDARRGAQWIARLSTSAATPQTARQGTCPKGWSEIGRQGRPGCLHGHEPMRHIRSIHVHHDGTPTRPEKIVNTF